MKEFPVTFNFDINDLAFGKYLKDAPYARCNFSARNNIITIIPENDLLITEHDDLKLYVERYDQIIEMGLLIPLMTKDKLISITNYYNVQAADFATENSVMMSQLGYTVEQKAAFVGKAVSEFREIKIHVEMYSYYVIGSMFDAVVRDEILTEERVTALKVGLLAKIAE